MENLVNLQDNCHRYKTQKMATTIKITPVVKGKESERFNAAISASKTNKVSEEKKAKIFSLVSKVMAKNNIT